VLTMGCLHVALACRVLDAAVDGGVSSQSFGEKAAAT
jgi:hypothetical protein